MLRIIGWLCPRSPFPIWSTFSRCPICAQSVMEGYFGQRQGRLAQEGLGALQRSMAGIYYLPFLTGTSLHFRFAGQSIPNRSAISQLWQPALPALPASAP